MLSIKFQAADDGLDDDDGSDDEMGFHCDQLYGRELDDLAILMASQAALHDLPWKKHLSEDNPRRGEVLEAKEKEIKGLLSPQPYWSNSN